MRDHIWNIKWSPFLTPFLASKTAPLDKDLVREVTIFEVIFGTRNGVTKVDQNRVPDLEVAAFLNWGQWLWQHPLHGQDVVLVNIDETPVYKQMQPRKGYVIQANLKRGATCYSRVPVKDKRGMSTALGCIVNVPELQPYMPQFILTKDTVMSKKEKELLASLAEPVRWVPGTKGWVSADNLKPLLTQIRKAIRFRRPNAVIVLCIDCAPVHTTHSTLTHCSRLGLHVLLLPGGLTWLLQPLDSHVFAAFKKKLAEVQEAKRGRELSGIMPPNAWVGLLGDAIHSVLVNQTWHKSFEQNGMSPGWEHCRTRILASAQPHLPLPPARPPSVDELDMMLGTKRMDFRKLVLQSSLRATALEASRRRPLILRPRARLPPMARHTVTASGSAIVRTGGPLPGPLPPLPPPVIAEPERLLRSGSTY